MNDTMKTLLERRSCRSYRPEQIEDEKLNAILEAGLYAPSARGMQSPVLVAIQDPEDLAALDHENAIVWGKPEAHPFYGAPTVVLVLADPTCNGPINAQRDGSVAACNMLNAAWSLGVSGCWINRAEEVFVKPEGKALLAKWGLPEHLVGVCNVILGYAAAEAPAAPARKEGRIVRI